MREKRLLAPSCPSVYPHVSSRLPLEGFPLNLRLGTFMKNCRESPVRYTYTAYLVVKGFYTAFCANPTNSWVTDSKSQTDSCGFDIKACSYFVKKA